MTVEQLVAHAVGDYVVQGDWMATEKTKRSLAAAVHAVTYTLVFLTLTRSPMALAVIGGTHFVIDRWRLARYVVWAKNTLGAPWTFGRTGPGGRPLRPGEQRRGDELELGWAVGTMAMWQRVLVRRRQMRPTYPRWSECTATGFPADRPVWLTTWLLIIVDNLMHIGINAAALHWAA